MTLRLCFGVRGTGAGKLSNVGAVSALCGAVKIVDHWQ